MHAAEDDGPLDLAQDVLGIDPCRRTLGQPRQDAHLPFAPLFSLCNLLPCLKERVMRQRIGTGEHSSHESIHSAAPPPIVSGLAGRRAVPHGDRARYATQPKLHSEWGTVIGDRTAAPVAIPDRESQWVVPVWNGNPSRCRLDRLSGDIFDGTAAQAAPGRSARKEPFQFLDDRVRTAFEGQQAHRKSKAA